MPTQSNLMGSGCPALQAQASVGLVNTGSATGASQGAQVMPSDFFVSTTTTLNCGPTLPATGAQCNAGDSFIAVNHGANSMNIWPPTGGKIGTAATNAAFAVASGKTAWFLSIGGGNFAASLSA